MREDTPDFYSWETPDFELTITPSGSLENYSDIVVTIQQGSHFESFHKEKLIIDGDKIYFTLDQETSGKFVGDRPANIQVNILYDNGLREASTFGELWVKPNLYRKVMA